MKGSRGSNCLSASSRGCNKYLGGMKKYRRQNTESKYSDTPSKKFVALGTVLPKPPQKTSCPHIAGTVWDVAGKTNPWELMGAREMISNR